MESQMNFPIMEVITNVRHFLRIVKEATGNVRSTEVVKKGSPKPGRGGFMLQK